MTATLGQVSTIIGISVGLCTLVTFIGTKLWDAHIMKEKYVTKEDLKACHAHRKTIIAGIADNESALDKKLRSMNKRLILGNLVMAELCHKAGVSLEKIDAFEKALGVRLTDNDE